MNYFTSDTHWGHKNIIEFSNRPWLTVEGMNEGLIQNWNEVVAPKDTVYHLGDVAFMSAENFLPILRRLNGNKQFILGNHDKMMNQLPNTGSHGNGSWQRYNTSHMEINIDKVPVVLCHYGMRVWNKSHYGAIHLFGHSHGSLDPHGKSVDVGVDAPWITGQPTYRPYSFTEIMRFMNAREWKPVDGHGQWRDKGEGM